MQHTTKKKRGFTLVELLVVVAIIGLLSTLAVVALGSARQRARDARRLADIKQVQTALELFFSDQNSYPVQVLVLDLGNPVDSDTLSSTNGFAGAAAGTTYMGLVPTPPTPPAGGTYNYISADGTTYTIVFQLESATAGLPGAVNLVGSPEGIRPQ